MKEVWDKLTGQSAQGKAQILIGTQLVAKGIDLRRATLVGVLQAESGLYIPDYTAGEKTFQLLTQAAGRSGRSDLKGKVIFQTYAPDNNIIKLASKHDYLSFYKNEILEREKHFCCGSI